MAYTPFKWDFKRKYTRKKRLLALLLTVAMVVGLLTANYNTITRYTLLYKEKRSLSTGTSEILFDKLSPKDEPQRLPEVLF